jgi:hypothetical protein
MTKRQRTKGQTTICKTLHRKIKIEQHVMYKPQQKPGMNSGAPEGYAVPAPHVAPGVLLLLQTR